MEASSTCRNGLEAAISALEKAQNVAIVTHRGPDGDAIGSSLAMLFLLRAQGKEATVYARPSDIGAPRILDGIDQLLPPENAELNSTRIDTLLCLDCASTDRISVPFFRENLAAFNVVNIDHHESNPRFGNVNWVVDDASSSGELVWTLAVKAGWDLSRQIAEALWTAVVTDTGRFSYSSTHPSTLECAANLLQYGVRQDYLNDELFSKSSLNALQLRARAYASLETWFDGSVAIIKLDAVDYAECRCINADSEDFVNIPRKLRGIKFAIFFYRSRADESCVHLSIRAYEPANACELAQAFGGGGHKAAAGATINNSSIPEAIVQVKQFLSMHLAK